MPVQGPAKVPKIDLGCPRIESRLKPDSKEESLGAYCVITNFDEEQNGRSLWFFVLTNPPLPPLPPHTGVFSIQGSAVFGNYPTSIWEFPKMGGDPTIVP